MARPGKTTVDYFPHVTRTGKTIAILEARWGNDGYAFWFKLLELLGCSEGFCYDCNKPSDWEYLLSKTRVTEDEAGAILKKLAEIDAIDAELWREGIIWSEHFAENLSPVFERRKCPPPEKPEFAARKCEQSEVSVPARDGNPASAEFPVTEIDKVKESKVKESKVDESKVDESTTTKNTAEENPAADLFASDCTSKRRAGAERQADTVYLKPAEAAKLAEDYGADGLARIIAILDDYKTNHPDKCEEYRDDYKVILAWVVSRYLGERGRFMPKRRPKSGDTSPPIWPQSRPAARTGPVRRRRMFTHPAEQWRIGVAIVAAVGDCLKQQGK